MMIPSSPEERKKMVNRMMNVCADNEEKLTEWELNFTHSLDENYRNKFDELSDRQCEILEKIYDKIS
jgi:hypothetical protein